MSSNLEAVELWHLDVEQDQIRPMLGDGLDRLEAVRALRQDLHIGVWGEAVSESYAGELLVVDDDHAKSCWARVPSPVVLCNYGVGIRPLPK